MDILKSILSYLNTKLNNYNNNVSDVKFFQGYKTYKDSLIDIINRGSISYGTTLALAESNMVISRFLDVISQSMNFITVIDKDGKEVKSSLSNTMLDEVKNIFADEGDWTEYIYNSMNMFLCCGMKLCSPTAVDDKGHTMKVEVLDNRLVSLYRDKSGEIALSYNGKNVTYFTRTLVKPNQNNRLYGSCIFSGAIKEALLDHAIRDTNISHYEGNANPSVIYMLDGTVLSGNVNELSAQFKKDLIEKYQGTEKSGIPFASTLVKDVKTVDIAPSVLKSVDIRLYNSKMLGMQLGVDIRGLGYMRDGGSQAELLAVYEQVNTEIKKRSEKLSKSITKEYNKFVADSRGLEFKFTPTYFTSNQQLFENAIVALKEQVVDKQYVQDLLFNQS